MKKVYPDRTECTNNDGDFHRLDGPAVEYKNGTKYWYQNGYLHRLDGPAIATADGIKSWYINGEKYSEQEWFEALTLEQQTYYLFKLGEK